MSLKNVPGETEPNPDGWNVYAFKNGSDYETIFVGSAESELEAWEIARRCGGHQIQYGLDGYVIVVEGKVI